MSYFQGAPLVFPPSYTNLTFPFPNNSLSYQSLSSLESPNSTSDSSLNDWRPNLLAYDNMNNYRLMSMLKMAESPQSCTLYSPESQTVIPRWNVKSEAGHAGNPIKIEQKSEPELEEVMLKKVKINCNGNYKQSEPMRLSSLVDQQMQKLSACARESVNRLLIQNKYKINKQSIMPNSYKTVQLLKQNIRPLRILAFKFNQDLNDFMYLVEWKERADGMKPNNSFLSKAELLRIDPTMIISYYEKQVAHTFQNFLFEN